jgi:cob(I)alamin adenosyltransferase
MKWAESTAAICNSELAMVEKSKIYTKGGDGGETSLVGGTRVSKGSAQIDLYGDVDELNSFIGIVTSLLKDKGGYTTELETLLDVQSALFDLGSNLACEDDKRQEFKLPQIAKNLIDKMELDIDRMDAEIPNLKNFILPGGTLISSNFHVCRTICRRVERKLISHGGNVENGIQFLNRLSDYFFIAARYFNHQNGNTEIEWVPKK